MGLLNFFRKWFDRLTIPSQVEGKRKVKAGRKRRSRKSSPRRGRSIEKIRADIGNLQTQIGTINIALNKHNDELLEHTALLTDNSKQLEKLEQIVMTTRIEAPVNQTIPTARPIAAANPPTMAILAAKDSPQKFDINLFSQQEKRILALFFQHKEMRLSYADLAQALNKSPHTIKNQMNRIRLKADLFDRTVDVDNDSRNRFKLKDDLRIEKYLNIG
jgi:DNA-binding CsgD family transcriptional regulator